MGIAFERCCMGLLTALGVAALVMLIPNAVWAGAYEDSGWITDQLDGTSSIAANRSSRADGDKSTARGKRGRRIASLGPIPDDSVSKQPSLSGGITWQAPSSCLSGSLVSVVAEVAANFGPVRVGSTCRSHGHNARAGGAPRSLHLTGDAVDFRVSGNVGAVQAFLRSHGSVGGLKHSGGGLFHIDTGARRPMR